MEENDVHRVAETSELKCDPCENENETETAVGYCNVCEEYLCDICFRAHRRLRATKHHEVRQVMEEHSEKTKKTSDNDILDNCPIHADQKLEFFCKSHEELSCLFCNSIIHNFCQNVEKIADLTDKTDNDKEMKVIKDELRNLEEHVADTSRCVNVRLNAVKLNHEEASSYIGRTRNEINELLDNRQNTISATIDAFRTKDSEMLKLCGNKCKDISFKISTLKNSLRSRLQPYGKIKLFVARQMTKSLIRTAERDLLEIRKNDSISRYKFAPSQELLRFKSELASFGTANIKPNAIRTSKFLKSVDVRMKSEQESCCITGVEVLDEGQVIAVVDERNKTLRLINTVENSIMSSVNFDRSPWDVTSLTDSRLAVTIPEKNCIARVEIRDSKLELEWDKVINVQGSCYGIAGYDEKLIVTFCNPAKIEILNDSGVSLKQFNVSLNEPKYIALDVLRSCMYVSDSNYNGGIYRRSFSDAGALEIKIRGSSGYGYGALALDNLGGLFSVYGCNHTITMNCIFEESVSKGKADDNFIKLNNSRPTSLAYSNERNILFVGSEGKWLYMYYVV